MNFIEPVIRDNYDDLPDSIIKCGIPLNRIMVVGDTNTFPLYGEAVSGILRKVFREVHTFVFRAGEEHKNLSSIEELLHALIDAHFDRKDCVAALGGGVVGDMAGFAASVCLRGIPVIQLPTTLLAQIDSSIGGKTGVDFGGFKNMVGSFHMPSLVYANTNTLQTLPEEQFISGMGEVVKTALLADAELYEWLKEHADRIRVRSRMEMTEMTERCALIKSSIVERDPRENGDRVLLNLGHTIGHAVEVLYNYTVPHGCCVSIGLCAAAAMSERRGLITSGDAADIRETCRMFGLPVKAPGLRESEVLAATKSDKKMSGGQIRFVLLESPGRAVYTDDVKEEELLAGIRDICI